MNQESGMINKSVGEAGDARAPPASPRGGKKLREFALFGEAHVYTLFIRDTSLNPSC